MRVLLAFLPLLGLVTAQMQRGNLAPRHPQDPFFNDLGIATSSRTQPPWARPPQHGAYPPQHGAQGQFGGNAGQSGSSTKPPYQNLPVAPMGGAQVPNNNPDANANPNAQGGNSGGLAGFGEADIFHGVLDERQPLPGAAPGAGVGLGQSSGPYGIHPDKYNQKPLNQNGMQYGKEAGQVGIGIDVPKGTGVVQVSAEKVNVDYFGGAPGVPGPEGGYQGQLTPDGGGRGLGGIDPKLAGKDPEFSPDLPAPPSGADAAVLPGGAALPPVVVGGADTVDTREGSTAKDRHFPDISTANKPRTNSTAGGDSKNLSRKGDSDRESGGGSAGTAAGVAVGFLVLTAFVAAVAFFIVKRRRRYGYLSPI